MGSSFLSLAATLLVVGVVVAAAVVVTVAWSLLHPPRMSDGKALYLLRRLTPADLGLAFEDATFVVRDHATGRRLRLAAWWVPRDGRAPGAADRCAVLVHGYADAKVGAIGWAPAWHAMGFHVLAIDLRGHGDSAGGASTAGWLERHDLAQVIDDLRAERPAEAREVVLFGVSLGAAVAVATAALDGDDNDAERSVRGAAADGDGGPEADAGRVTRALPSNGDGRSVADAARTPRISAVVLESPFADFRHVAWAHLDRLGMPGGWLRRASLRLAEWLVKADFDAVRPADLIARAPCPVMVITSAEDPYLLPGDADAIERAVRARPSQLGPSVHWRVEAADHLEAASAFHTEYRARLAEFIDAALPATSTPSARPGLTL